MSESRLSGSILRFWMGLLASILVSYPIFRGDLFVPGTRPFQCVTIGALMSGILALVRAGHPMQALSLVAGFGVLQLGLLWNLGWPQVFTGTLSNLFAAAVMFVIAVIFDSLANRGMRFGKFLVVGPLLGGLYLAITPLAGWGKFSLAAATTEVFKNLWLGILIGNGVGLGVELAELLPGVQPARTAPEPPPAEAAPPAPEGPAVPGKRP